MVPQGKPVDETIAKLEPLLNPGDILIDGGNSNYKDSMRRHKEVTAKGFQFVDVGTSGGVWGLKEGYSMMIGGDKEPVEYLRPIFETLAPAADKGWGHVGPARRRALCEDGSQRHRVRHDAGLCRRVYDAGEERRACAEPAADCADLALRQRGAELAAGPDGRCAGKNPTLDGLEAYVEDSGEGRWTVFEAIDLNVSAPVITESLMRRIRSREENNFTDRMLAIMRNEFGGHAVKKD